MCAAFLKEKAERQLTDSGTRVYIRTLQMCEEKHQFNSHKWKCAWLRQPLSWRVETIILHHHNSGGRQEREAETPCQTRTSTHAHTNTHLMVTTWLDQNKDLGQALFSAELIFLKGAQSDELVSRSFILFLCLGAQHIKHLYLTNFLYQFL